jgi:hypothetical protein
MKTAEARERNTEPDTINIAECDGWAVATDRVQWILRRRRGSDKLTEAAIWRDVSFVHTTLDILERCMREKGAPSEVVHSLLEVVGSRFGNQFDPEQRGGQKNVSRPTFTTRGVIPSMSTEVSMP